MIVCLFDYELEEVAGFAGPWNSRTERIHEQITSGDGKRLIERSIDAVCVIRPVLDLLLLEIIGDDHRPCDGGDEAAERTNGEGKKILHLV